MARMMKLVVAAGMDKMADLVEAITALGLVAILETGDGETAAVVGNAGPAATPKRAAVVPMQGNRKGVARRNGGGRRSVYVAVSGHKKEAAELSENRAAVYASIVKHPNEGMGDHQRRLAGKVEPKTVDGSIFYLRSTGLVKSIDAK